MSNPDQILQMESWLGRSLTPEELVPVESLEVLSPAHLAVVEILAPRSAFSAMLYLRNVVPSALVRDIQPFVDDFASGSRAAQPREWPNLALFERYAGRALSAAEKCSVSALDELSPEHIALATIFARQDQTVAFLYLSRVVPSATPTESGSLVRQLAQSEA
jgi:hypothetical protein